jgi:hypothetical protein
MTIMLTIAKTKGVAWGQPLSWSLMLKKEIIFELLQLQRKYKQIIINIYKIISIPIASTMLGISSPKEE